jgi:inner membrane protein involved in colicin E2 resistance
MKKHLASLVFIFFFTSVAWMILGLETYVRTNEKDITLRKAVGELWGTEQKQEAPGLYYTVNEKRAMQKINGKDTTFETRWTPVQKRATIYESKISARFDIEYRKKGLLWYSTYRVEFAAAYQIENESDSARDYDFTYRFPNNSGIYDNFNLIIDGKEIDEIKPIGGKIIEKINLQPGEQKAVKISYVTQGMDKWWYIFSQYVSQIRNFDMTIYTNFEDIDFPENSISPTSKSREDDGWKLQWQYDNLISGIQIGLKMPHKLNPGPFASRVSFFAPVSLFLFMFLLFIITTIKEIKIHPMNYFFIAAAFFSFHLLLAYLADQVDIRLAFAISAVVSIFLVVSYMRLVVGTKMALLEVGISQFVYLVLFSYAFFLKGITGLSITILCIITLFVVMQLTGRINWEEKFAQMK